MTKSDIIRKYWPRPSQVNISNIKVMEQAIEKMMDEHKGKSYEVTGCKDCPFYTVQMFYDAFCGHPVYNAGQDGKHIGKNTGDYLTPDWCPLNKGSITITKSKSNVVE